MSRGTPSGETVARQRRASDPAASAWVSANAGSGKTYVLAQRVARLMLAGTPPGRILCLTFTKAAAANMANRVFGWLAEWTRLDDTGLAQRLEDLGEFTPNAARLARARRLFAEALETPGGLKILTIHGFCERVLQLFPFESQVTPRFSVLDDRSAAALVAEARARVVTEAAAHPDGALGRAMAAVIAHASDTAFHKALTEALSARGPLARAMTDAPAGTGAAGLIAEAARALEVPPGATPESLDAEMLAGIGPERWLDLAVALEEGSASDVKCGAALRAALAAGDEAVRRALYGGLFFTKDGKPRKSIHTQGFAKLFPALAEELDAEKARLVQIAERHRAATALVRTAGLLTLADAILAAYARAKALRGALDFDDLVAKTRALFTRIPSSWAHYKLDEGIDHVLVDEAQDTNPDQWEIVASLTSEFTAGFGARGPARRTVFAVGDEKQSIYGFQGAAPEAFDAWRRAYALGHDNAELTFHDVRLTQSFRSTRDVLEAVDHVFAPLEAHEGLEAVTAPTLHETVRAEAPGLVEIWPPVRAIPAAATAETAWDAPFDEARGSSAQGLLAERIAGAVTRLTRDGDPEAGRPPVGPGDVLILVRSRGALFEAILRALKASGVPVAGADRLVLGEHIAVLDLLALGDAVTTPGDDLALAAALKSPLFGLDDDDLMTLAPTRPGRLVDALAQAAGGRGRSFETAAARLPQDEAVGAANVVMDARHIHHPHPEEARRAVSKDRPHTPDLAPAHARYTRWRGLAAHATPFDFYARVLGRDGGRRAFRARLGPEADDVLDEFLKLALAFGREAAPTLAGFLHWMRAAEVEIKRDLDVASGEVRVMTVHGAKGLEAKTVILADLGAPPTGSRDACLMSLPTTAGPVPVWSPRADDDPAPVAAARLAARAKADAEHRRLLYVALTRAEDHLIIAAALGANQKEPPPRSWYALARAGLAGHAREIARPGFEEPALAFRVTEGAVEAPAVAAPPVAPAAVRPAWADRPPPPETEIAVLRPSALGGLAAPAAIRAPAAHAPDGRRRGILIHRLAERLPALPPAAREDAARRYLGLQGAVGAAQGTVAGGPDEGPPIAAEALALVAHPELAHLFEASLAEVPLAGTVEISGVSYSVSGRIDRLVREPGGLLLVDLKTDRVRPAERPPAYVAQLALYRVLARKILPGQRVDAAILWTAEPFLDRIAPETLDAAMAMIRPVP